MNACWSRLQIISSSIYKENFPQYGPNNCVLPRLSSDFFVVVVGYVHGYYSKLGVAQMSGWGMDSLCPSN